MSGLGGGIHPLLPAPRRVAETVNEEQWGRLGPCLVGYRREHFEPTPPDRGRSADSLDCHDTEAYSDHWSYDHGSHHRPREFACPPPRAQSTSTRCPARRASA